MNFLPKTQKSSFFGCEISSILTLAIKRTLYFLSLILINPASFSAFSILEFKYIPSLYFFLQCLLSSLINHEDILDYY